MRESWLGAPVRSRSALSCLVVFGTGIFVALLIYGVLAPLRHRLTMGTDPGRVTTSRPVLLRLLLDLLPVLAFAVTADVALELPPDPVRRLATPTAPHRRPAPPA